MRYDRFGAEADILDVLWLPNFKRLHDALATAKAAAEARQRARHGTNGEKAHESDDPHLQIEVSDELLLRDFFMSRVDLTADDAKARYLARKAAREAARGAS